MLLSGMDNSICRRTGGTGEDLLDYVGGSNVSCDIAVLQRLVAVRTITRSSTACPKAHDDNIMMFSATGFHCHWFHVTCCLSPREPRDLTFVLSSLLPSLSTSTRCYLSKALCPESCSGLKSASTGSSDPGSLPWLGHCPVRPRSTPISASTKTPLLRPCSEGLISNRAVGGNLRHHGISERGRAAWSFAR